ncbi:sel1 repeat family protein [Pseudomonas sp. DTU12.3]|uniref:tetratricopeptide repeat protein n=1 Tax=Pseudomonas sp. DTU12.3 TaxID=2073078 RepID=UPI001012BD15|nr:sel1 repeat family protein [Pseudomonas sp. DTU12.3]QAX85076.1 sel1 repeat family protein [Pseudomonas sp. DTU12.3]
MRLFRYFFVATFLISATSTFASQSAHEISAGITLYNQLKLDAAFPVLEKEAQSGNAESQYYLGEALRKRNRYMTPEAQRWYETAAMNGSIYAMIRLGRSGNDLCKTMSNCPETEQTPSDWLRNVETLAKPKAEQGDEEAMYIMYEVTLNRDWLEKSANAGNAEAQYWMAIGDRQGEGFLLLWKRNESVGKWFRASAEGGNPRAMMEYAAYLHENDGDLKEARHWIKMAAEKGYESGVSSYGAYLAHAPDRFGFELDLVKGYAITSLLKDLDGGGNVQVYVEEVLPEIAAKMTPSQIKEADEFAAQWKKSHLPLSFFPDKLGN